MKKYENANVWRHIELQQPFRNRKFEIDRLLDKVI